jgi:hypothetical protein
MIPTISVMSTIITTNTAEDVLENPLSSVFHGLIIGSIGGIIIESITHPCTRPFIVGGILFLGGVNVIGRTMGIIRSPPCRYVETSDPLSIHISSRTLRDE